MFDVALDWLKFTCMFASIGAVGFHFGVLRRAATLDLATRELVSDRAASIGAFGAAAWFLLMMLDVGLAAADHGKPFVSGINPVVMLRIGALLLTVLGFIVARRRVESAWTLAAVGILVAMLYKPVQGLMAGKWAAMVNPLHEIGGGLWIGTLFVLVFAGIGSVKSTQPSGRLSRGTTVAVLVRAFSPLALTAAGLLVVMGVITAFRHLDSLDLLWTTPYGIALIVKLCLVAGVVTVGAWNWRKIGPSLGSDNAIGNIRRSARWELILAGLVLVATAILVNLPDPK